MTPHKREIRASASELQQNLAEECGELKQARHTFATEALAAGISIFELARLMGVGERGHLARDSEDAIRARLDAGRGRSGVYPASEGDGDRAA